MQTMRKRRSPAPGAVAQQLEKGDVVRLTVVTDYEVRVPPRHASRSSGSIHVGDATQRPRLTRAAARRASAASTGWRCDAAHPLHHPFTTPSPPPNDSIQVYRKLTATIPTFHDLLPHKKGDGAGGDGRLRRGPFVIFRRGSSCPISIHMEKSYSNPARR